MEFQLSHETKLICNCLCSKTLKDRLIISIEGPAAESFPYEKACDIWANGCAKVHVHVCDWL